jgi:hypothetical protein
MKKRKAKRIENRQQKRKFKENLSCEEKELLDIIADMIVSVIAKETNKES